MGRTVDPAHPPCARFPPPDGRTPTRTCAGAGGASRARYCVAAVPPLHRRRAGRPATPRATDGTVPPTCARSARPSQTGGRCRATPRQLPRLAVAFVCRRPHPRGTSRNSPHAATACGVCSTPCPRYWLSRTTPIHAAAIHDPKSSSTPPPPCAAAAACQSTARRIALLPEPHTSCACGVSFFQGTASGARLNSAFHSGAGVLTCRAGWAITTATVACARGWDPAAQRLDAQFVVCVWRVLPGAVPAGRCES
jgi:hypothetical protein